MGTVLEPRGAGVADARGRHAASPQGGWVGKAKSNGGESVTSGGSILISVLLSARIRERRPASCLPGSRASVPQCGMRIELGLHWPVGAPRSV